MKTNNESILSILLPSIGILILSILGFLLVVSCNAKPVDKDAQQKTEEKPIEPIERISNLESGYCVISDSNDLTQMQLKIKSENIDTETYKPAIKITLNDKTVTMTNYSMYCMN